MTTVRVGRKLGLRVSLLGGEELVFLGDEVLKPERGLDKLENALISSALGERRRLDAPWGWKFFLAEVEHFVDQVPNGGRDWLLAMALTRLVALKWDALSEEAGLGKRNAALPRTGVRSANGRTRAHESLRPGTCAQGIGQRRAAAEA